MRGGIGGTIKDSSGHIIYCFSSPSAAFTVHEAEVEAYCMP